MSITDEIESIVARLLREEKTLVRKEDLKKPLTVVQLETPGVPVNRNVTLTTADKEYEIEFPIGTKKFSFRLRSTHYPWRFSFEKGRVAGSVAPYNTVPAAGEFYDDNLKTPAGVKLYVACSTAAQTLEAVFWV